MHHCNDTTACTLSQDCWIVYRFLNSAAIEIMAIVPWEDFLPDADR